MNVTMSLDPDVLARLVALAEETGQPVSTTLARLLDREPHDHEHRCPTCVRMAHDDHSHRETGPTLFAV